ncbi:hypothetical protein HUU42_09465 [bacterium]|nr:hypothetical protein [bacterium]
MRIAVRHRVVDGWQHIDVVLYRIVILCHSRESGYPDLTHRFGILFWIPAYAGMTTPFDKESSTA